MSSPVSGLIGLLSIVAASTAFAEPAPPSQPAPAVISAAPDGTKNGQPREDAVALAALLNPAEPLVELAGRSFDQAFDKMADGGDIAALEKEHPGIVGALRKAARDAVAADVRDDMPSLHRRYGRYISDHFTPEEVAELNAFYRSPTGAKIIQAKFANVDISGLVGKMAEDPDAKVSTADIEAMNQSAMSGMWQGMNADDVRSMLAFGLRPVARKLKDAAPALAEIETEIANEPDPALDARIDEAMQKVYEQYGLEVD